VEFDWDEGNRDKNLKHGIHDWEIEEAMEDPHALPADAHPGVGERRRAILGRSPTSGRYLKIVYTIKVRDGRNLFRPISAIAMSLAERARYSR